MFGEIFWAIFLSQVAVYGIIAWVIKKIYDKIVEDIDDDEEIEPIRKIAKGYGFRDPLKSAYEKNPTNGLYTPIKPKRSDIDEI